MAKPYGPKYEKEKKKLRDLQRNVLEHLKTRGPLHYDGLYVLFDLHRTGEIGPALQDLEEWGKIDVGKDRLVGITAAGVSELEDMQRTGI